MIASPETAACAGSPSSAWREASAAAAPPTQKISAKTAIASASKVILLWTDAGSKSDWVNYEAGMADALGKPIVVVIPEGSPAELPENLKDAQIVRIKQDV